MGLIVDGGMRMGMEVDNGNDLKVTAVSISGWTRVAPSLLGCP